MLLVSIGEGFSDTLPLVVAGSRPDRVDVPPTWKYIIIFIRCVDFQNRNLLILGLGMDFWIAIDLYVGRVSWMNTTDDWELCDIPEVLEMRNRAFVRLARPSILSVPIKDVLIVLTGLY